MSGTVQSDFATFLTQLRSAWLYRRYAAGSAWLFCLAGWLAVALVPSQYEASARVHVDTQGILKPLLAGLTIEPNREQQLAMMTRTLLSRPNIERVISTAGLDSGLASARDREELVDHLSKRIELRSADQNNIYSIVYSDKSPVDARNVVESLLKMLVEDSAGEQRRDSDQAHGFLTEQIAVYEKRLADAEAVLRDFKRQNPEFQPGKDYFARLGESEAALSAARLELKEAENRRAALRRQVTVDSDGDALSSEESINPQLEARIQELRRSLDGLRLRFTEEHPDVISTRGMLERLEQQQRQEIAATRKAGSDFRARPRFQNLQLAMAEADASVASLQVRVAEYQRRRAAMKAVADQMPGLEAAFAGLNREYEANKQSFEKLLARRESVQISQDADARNGIVAFRVIDPPRVPRIPTSPNRPVLVSLVLLLGVAGGMGLAFLMSQVRPTISDPRNLREVTGLPVLGVVSEVWTLPERSARRRGLYAWVGAYVGLAVAYGGVMAVLTTDLLGNP